MFQRLPDVACRQYCHVTSLTGSKTKVRPRKYEQGLSVQRVHGIKWLFSAIIIIRVIDEINVISRSSALLFGVPIGTLLLCPPAKMLDSILQEVCI